MKDISDSGVKRRAENTMLKKIPSSIFSRGPVSNAISHAPFNWPFPDFSKPQRWWKFTSKWTVFAVGMSSKIILSGMNSCRIYNKNILLDAIFKRPPGVPLLTVANHDSCIDDPLLAGNSGVLMSWSQLLDQKNMRWNLAAHDICFTKPSHSWFFSRGKCVPVIRGLGTYQKSVDFIIDRLNCGDWVHIFPEGRVNPERDYSSNRLKWGIGRLISECRRLPIVIPFWHHGMEDVLPNKKPYIPRVGQRVTMYVAPPLNLRPIMESVEEKTPLEKRKAVTDFIQEELLKTRPVTMELHDWNRNPPPPSLS